ncbi:MAG: DUF5615 family PIN-like protein [Bacteroidota bacterium]
MDFLVDAHFPVRLKNWLIENGEDAIHTTDLPQKNLTPDIEIMMKADREKRIVVTKDKDFLEHRILKGIPDRLLMVTTGNIINRELIRLFEVNFQEIKKLFTDGSKVIEINHESISVHE